MQRLLGPEDPPPVLERNCGNGSPWVLTADHAGNHVPKSLASLGLAAADLADHIGVDIGIWAVTVGVAEALGAVAIGQRYSRLVIDCNRQPGTPASIPLASDGRAVPGNVDAEASGRVHDIFEPYHAVIASRLTQRTLLAAMHSFTRVLGGKRREVDIGVIHGARTRLADAVLAELAGCGLRVERNSPYSIDFVGDYTVPVHGEAPGLDYVELEICQDLITNPAGQIRLAGIVSGAFRRAQLSLA